MVASDAHTVAVTVAIQQGMIPKSASAIISEADEHASRIASGSLAASSNQNTTDDPAYLSWRVGIRRSQSCISLLSLRES